MAQFIVGIRTANGGIHEVKVNATDVSLYGEDGRTYWNITGESPGGALKMLISPDAFLFALPSEMLFKERER